MFELLVTVAYDANNRVYLLVLLLWKKRRTIIGVGFWICFVDM
jgi:hypothetical protein